MDFDSILLKSLVPDVDAELQKKRDDETVKEDIANMIGGMDTRTGAPWWPRLKAAFQHNREDAKRSLQESLGTNVFDSGDGRLAFIDPKTGRGVLVDETQTTWVDALELLPAAIPIAASVGSALATGGLSVPAQAGIAAIAGMAGTEVKQRIAQAVGPQERTATEQDLAKERLLSGALEFAGPLVFSGLTRAGKGIYSKFTGASDEALESAKELAQRTGIKTTIGQAAKGGVAESGERYLRQMPFSRDVFRGPDKEALGALASFADNTAERLTGKSPKKAVKLAIAADKKYTEKLIESRTRRGNIDFGEVDRLSGDMSIFDIRRVFRKMDEFVEEYGQKGVSDEADAIRESVAKRKESIMELVGESPDGKITGKQMRRLLSGWSKSAYDPRGVFEKVKDVKKKKVFAVSVLSELVSVLDDAAESTGASGEVARAIKVARQNWADGTKEIMARQTHPLAEKTFGKTPEKLISVLSKDTPENYEKLGAVMEFLNKQAPASAEDVRGAVVKDLRRRVTVLNEEGVEEINAAALASELSKNRRMYRLLFAGSKEGQQAVDDMAKAAGMLKKVGGSQTFHMQAITSAVMSGAGAAAGAFAGAPGASFGAVGTLAVATLLQRHAAKSLLNEKAMRAYATIYKASANPQLMKVPSFKEKLSKAVSDAYEFAKREAVEEAASVAGRVEMEGREPIPDAKKEQEQLEALQEQRRIERQNAGNGADALKNIQMRAL